MPKLNIFASLLPLFLCCCHSTSYIQFNGPVGKLESYDRGSVNNFLPGEKPTMYREENQKVQDQRVLPSPQPESVNPQVKNLSFGEVKKEIQRCLSEGYHKFSSLLEATNGTPVYKAILGK